MARLSPSPSGSSRRLSELLEEQQEPFSLDIYLLDKGCSPTLLDEAVGSSGASSTCWPSSRSTSPALRRMVVSRKTRVSGRIGLLLSKILRTVPAAKKKQVQAAASDCGPVDGEKTPSNLKNAVASPPPCAVEANVFESEEENDDDDGSSKQLSPVSVLEQRLFEQSPPAYVQKAMVIFKELLDVDSNPPLLDELGKDSSNNKSKDDCNQMSTTTTAAPAPTRTDRCTGATHWEEMFEAELAKVYDLIASDMARAGVGPQDVRQERSDVGSDIAVAVLEALTEEIAVELMRMYHDDAIDK